MNDADDPALLQILDHGELILAGHVHQMQRPFQIVLGCHHRRAVMRDVTGIEQQIE